MTDELNRRKFHGVWVRIHDSGDFFTDAYLLAWLRIMRARPATHFYAYTKEVTRFRTLVEPDPPANFRWVYSYGGRQDTLLAPTPVGIPANHIPRFLKKLGTRTFRTWQTEADAMKRRQ